ncbi:hypothetical protein RCL1_006926 [Eukaryota sp. TZLM3-RCL]
MFRGKVPVEYFITVHSLSGVVLSNRPVFVQWKRGTKLTGQSRRALLTDGSCNWQETISFTCTLVSAKSSTSFRKKLFELSVFEDLGVRGSKLIGQLSLDLSSYYQRELSASEIQLSKCSHPNASIRISIRTPSPSSLSSFSSPADVSSPAYTPIDGDTDDFLNEVSDVTSDMAPDVVSAVSDGHVEERPKYKPPLPTTPRPTLTLPPSDPSITPPVRSVVKKRRHQRGNSSIFVTSPSNWGLNNQNDLPSLDSLISTTESEAISPLFPSDSSSFLPSSSSLSQELSVSTSPNLDDLVLEIPQIPIAESPSFVSSPSSLEISSPKVPYIDYSTSQNLILNYLISTDFSYNSVKKEDLILIPVLLIKSFALFNSFCSLNPTKSTDFILKSCESIHKIIKTVDQLTSCVPTPSIRLRKNSISFNNIYGTELGTLLYWIHGSLLISVTSQNFIKNLSPEQSISSEILVSEFNNFIRNNSQSKFSINFDCSSVCTIDFDNLFDNSFLNSLSACSYCKSFLPRKQTFPLSPLHAISLTSHLMKGLLRNCIKGVLKWVDNSFTRLLSMDLILSASPLCGTPPRGRKQGGKGVSAPILADIGDITNVLLELLTMCVAYSLDLSVIELIFSKAFSNLDARLFNFVLISPSLATLEGALRLKLLANTIRSSFYDTCLKHLCSNWFKLVDQVSLIFMVDVELLKSEEERNNLCPDLNLIQLDSLLSLLKPSNDFGKDYIEKVKQVQIFINSLIPLCREENMELEIDLSKYSDLDLGDLVSVSINFDWMTCDVPKTLADSPGFLFSWPQ